MRPLILVALILPPLAQTAYGGALLIPVKGPSVERGVRLSTFVALAGWRANKEVLVIYLDFEVPPPEFKGPVRMGGFNETEVLILIPVNTYPFGGSVNTSLASEKAVADLAHLTVAFESAHKMMEEAYRIGNMTYYPPFHLAVPPSSQEARLLDSAVLPGEPKALLKALKARLGVDASKYLPAFEDYYKREGRFLRWAAFLARFNEWGTHWLAVKLKFANCGLWCPVRAAAWNRPGHLDYLLMMIGRGPSNLAGVRSSVSANIGASPVEGLALSDPDLRALGDSLHERLYYYYYSGPSERLKQELDYHYQPPAITSYLEVSLEGQRLVVKNTAPFRLYLWLPPVVVSRFMNATILEAILWPSRWGYLDPGESWAIELGPGRYMVRLYQPGAPMYWKVVEVKG